MASVSPLGRMQDEIWKNYLSNKHFIVNHDNNLVARLSETSVNYIETLRASDSKYKSLDNSVLYAIDAARRAVKKAKWSSEDNFGINIGSSRGATALFEKYYDAFLKEKKAETLSSPTTTLGNISSWLAHDLQTKGPEISHSITCSTALHAMLNGIAWINSGMCDKFLVGGSEAPLTPFTIAQMQALKIYAKCHSEHVEESFPCKALDANKNENTMVLGEGASVICLEKSIKENTLATIKGIGYATESLEHNVSLSSDAMCFQRSMSMALTNIEPKEIDIIITHTPGTIKGDNAELNAIKKVFSKKTPALTTNKWKIGHTLGASGALNIEMAVLMLQKEKFIGVPFLENKDPKQIKNILVNAVGFGGNAVSILISKS